jgi:tetratricopeptide (TPR) repeat protein
MGETGRKYFRMMGRIRLYLGELSLVIVTVMVVLAMVVLNDVCVQIRMKELQVILQSGDYEESNLDHIGLLMKYDLHRKMYEDKISNEKADTLEIDVNRLISERASYREVPIRKYEYASIPVVGIINSFRFIIGKPRLRDFAEDKSTAYLDTAYYYERNKYYGRALMIYDKALKEVKRDRMIIASIMLHQGFCNALLGNYEEAKTLYLKIINDYSDKSVAITAAILLKYLEGFRAEYRRVLRGTFDPVKRSEKLYKLLAFREAVKTLKEIEKKANRPLIARLNYYKGKCYEELGEKETALNSYLEVITNDHRSSFARLANRRVYIIGSQVKEGRNIQEIAFRINEVLKDKKLDSMVKDEFSFRKDKNTAPEKEEIAIRNSLLEGIGRLVDKGGGMKRDYVGKRVKVITGDGNTFVGEVIADSVNHISLMTSIGSVTVTREKVKRIQQLR